MATKNYANALAFLLVHEGGYSNHPADPGGATMKGVTQRVYDAFNKRRGQSKKSVKNITDEEIAMIYREQYAEKVKFNEMPDGLDYVMFDGAVNSGPSQATKWLQRALLNLGLYKGRVDGVIGNGTLQAIAEVSNVDALVSRICDIRMAFLKALKTWRTFGKGWSRRVNEVGDIGQDWASGTVPKDKNATYVAGMEAKARVEDADLPSAPVNGPTTGAAGGVVAGTIETARQQLEPYVGSSPIVSNILVGLVVIATAVALGGVVWGIYANRKRKSVAKALDLDVAVAN